MEQFKSLSKITLIHYNAQKHNHYTEEAFVSSYSMKRKKKTPNTLLGFQEIIWKEIKKNWNTMIIRENFPVTSNSYQNEDLSSPYSSRKSKIPYCLCETKVWLISVLMITKQDLELMIILQVWLSKTISKVVITKTNQTKEKLLRRRRPQKEVFFKTQAS